MDSIAETSQHNNKIGQRIRNLRKMRHLSVRELAEKSGLSAIAISKIERDQVSPTLKSLEQLSGALELKVIDFFLEDLDNDVILNHNRTWQEGSQQSVNIANLASGLRDQNLEPYLVQMQPGETIHCDALASNGEVFVWCLQGASAFDINQKQYEIAGSENILFRSYMPFTVSNPGLEKNELLFVFEAPLGKQFANQMLH